MLMMKKNFICAPSPNYYINEESEPVKAKMITKIDDICNIIKDNEDEQNTTLIHNENDLIKCCFDLLKVDIIQKLNFQVIV